MILNWECKLLTKILIEEGEFNEVNLNRLTLVYIFKKKILTTSDNDLYLTLDSLIEINDLIINKHNQNLRQTQVRLSGYNFQYMHFSKININLQSLIDRFNGRQLTKTAFVKEFLNIHPFLDGNGRTVKVLMIYKKN